MHKALRLCLLLLLLAALPVTALAQEFNPNQRGAISLSLVSPGEEIPLEGAQLALYYVAAVKAGTDGSLLYSYTEPFADCGISLEDTRLAEKLDAFVSQYDLPSQTVRTDGEGSALWENLELGLYLVKQIGQVEGFATCASFLVTVPMTAENGFLYAVDASPKMEVARLVTVTVQKVWNTDKTAKIPESVTVQLMHGETPISTDVLNQENNWQVVYPDMPESDAYRIEELDVAKGFTATYGRKGYVFTVTNTSSLVQTGQLIWPIPVLAVAGLFLLAMGYGILRKQGKRNG
jgi:hypothetical protein